MTPSVGRIVHYVSRGSADGVYPATCRAAIVTAVGDVVAGTSDLCVLNPQGLFFDVMVVWDEGRKPGTWHWPERVE